MRRSIGVSFFATLAIFAASCGGDEGGSGELTDVTLNIVPFSPNAIVFHAIESGIFERHGLNVEIERAASPIPVVSSLVAGQAQFGFITTPVLVNANREGTPLQCVAPVDGQVSPDRDSSALVSARDSGIDSLDDLSNRTVAVVQLSSINLIGAREQIEEAGGTNVEYVALPFPQMPQALEDGRVDAAVITSPYVDTALENGAVELSHPSSDLFPRATVYCYGATTDFLSENPDVAGSFRDAMTEAIEYTRDNESEVLATLEEYLDLSPEEAQNQIIPSNYVPELNVESITEIQELMRDQGSLPEVLDSRELVWEPPA